MFFRPIKKVKHATLLSHGRKPEVNISHASLSQIVKLIASTSETILESINVVVSRLGK